MVAVPNPQPAHRVAAFLVAPRKRHRRNWIERQPASPRGRFELALIGGGVVALVFASALPGMSGPGAVALLLAGGCAMTAVASIVGFVPSLAASIFAPLVVALSDPMWTLGATLSDFTLAIESSLTFAIFAAAALAGTGIRLWRRQHRAEHRHGLWRAAPR